MLALTQHDHNIHASFRYSYFFAIICRISSIQYLFLLLLLLLRRRRRRGSRRARRRRRRRPLRRTQRSTDAVVRHTPGQSFFSIFYNSKSDLDLYNRTKISIRSSQRKSRTRKQRINRKQVWKRFARDISQFIMKLDRAQIKTISGPKNPVKHSVTRQHWVKSNQDVMRSANKIREKRVTEKTEKKRKENEKKAKEKNWRIGGGFGQEGQLPREDALLASHDDQDGIGGGGRAALDADAQRPIRIRDGRILRKSTDTQHITRFTNR